jgi:H+/Cl- antiporter ClcA
MQMGGGIAANLCRIFKLNPRDRSLFIMCGMSGLISVLFGTPLMATFLSMEVISIGVIYYAAFLPCLLTSLTAFLVSELFGITPMRYTLADIPALNALTVVQVAILAVACGAVSILFCGAMKLWGTNSKKYIPNQYYRILFGSLIVVVLTLILGTQAYNGSSAALLNTAINYGTAHPLDFAFKLILTAITLQSGFKGGAVFPALVIGATFGCQFGALIGIDPCFAAAIGMIAVFCGSVNCPIASILFAAEVFGGTSLVLFAIAVAISFVFSGYFTIFPGQHFIYSKLRMEYKNSGLRE